ncbi:hypothetical protein TNCV_699001 [Trichonephila clavipes]|nr:hypothetical protein TNCV_699001 [Trichonephila clavipes]
MNEKLFAGSALVCHGIFLSQKNSSKITRCFVKRFEETESWRIEHEPGRPCLKEARAPALLSKWKRDCVRRSFRTSRVEAARRLGFYHHHLSAIFFVESSSCTPYKLQSCYELFASRYRPEGSIYEVGLPLKWNRIPIWVFNILWTDETHFSLHGPFLFETQCPVKWMDNGNGKCSALSNASAGDCCAMFNSTRHSGKTESLAGAAGTHGLPRSPDLTPTDFWLWGYLKSRVYLSGPSSLSELKYAIRRELHTSGRVALPTVAGFVTRLECLLSPWWWSCGVIKL